jgi:hypothetical protein
MRIVVAGALANKPGNGGEAWVRLAWIRGLRDLGAEVRFVEVLDPGSPAGASREVDSLRASSQVRFFEAVCSRWGLTGCSTLITPEGEHLAGGLPASLMEFAEGADLLVNISGHLSYQPLLRSVRRRAYIDLDPGFTQFWHAGGESGLGLGDHDVYFTVGENVGTPACSVPAKGIRWLPIRQPVVLSDWPEMEPPHRLRFTTVASWRGAYGPVVFGERTYGLKVHEFRRFARLPEEVPARVEVALDIHPDDERDLRMLKGHGWAVTDPRLVASTPEAFRAYVQGSGAELSVAQGIYVETRSGWFSDRSARYLATGRPVVVQDTGVGRRLPVGEGLLTFRTVPGAARAARDVVRAYDRHRRTARQIAEEFFDARTVLTAFLERAMDVRATRTNGSAGVHTPSPSKGSTLQATLATSLRHPGGLSPSPTPATSPRHAGGLTLSPTPATSPRHGGNGKPAGRRRAVVSGMIAGVPGQGGATWAVLQYVLGLLRLGWDAYLVEEVTPSQLTPQGTILEHSANARYFRETTRRFCLDGRAALLLEGTNQTVGLPYAEVKRIADGAEVLLNLSGGLSDRLRESVPVLAYVDLDPAFTQLWREVQGVDMGLDGHTHFVTVGLALGTPSCPVPTCDRDWIQTLPPVVLEEWPETRRRPSRDSWTTVANWRSYGSIHWNGRHLGQKAHGFRPLFSLPSLCHDRFELALAIHPDEKEDAEALRRNGWSLVDPAEVAGDPGRYRRFVRGSAAELCVAKTGYVESRSGWFSDRSACYLASGRPVLAQDTGFSHHLPTGLGLLPFSSVEEAAEGVERIRRDYPWHARTARRIAETYFGSGRVLSRLMRELLT